LSSYFQSLLEMRLGGPWTVKDQSKGGHAPSGLSLGERDGMICFDGNDIAVIEALILDSVKADYIENHVSKAMISYNPVGVHFIFVVVYYKAKSWNTFWDSYKAYLNRLEISEFQIAHQETFETPQDVLMAENLRHIQYVYQSKNRSAPLIVQHIAFNLSSI
jgi:hypothetical protein